MNLVIDLEKQLETYLHAQIPISQAMGIKIERASTDSVILWAPLHNNINHKQTAFGGSLQAAATLACWGLLHLKLRESAYDFQIVITRSEIDYLFPVDSDFKVECRAPSSQEWERFLNQLNRIGKARIRLNAQIFQKNHLCVDYMGIFAALPVKAA